MSNYGCSSEGNPNGLRFFPALNRLAQKRVYFSAGYRHGICFQGDAMDAGGEAGQFRRGLPPADLQGGQACSKRLYLFADFFA